MKIPKEIQRYFEGLSSHSLAVEQLVEECFSGKKIGKKYSKLHSALNQLFGYIYVSDEIINGRTKNNEENKVDRKVKLRRYNQC